MWAGRKNKKKSSRLFFCSKKNSLVKKNPPNKTVLACLFLLLVLRKSFKNKAVAYPHINFYLKKIKQPFFRQNNRHNTIHNRHKTQSLLFYGASGNIFFSLAVMLHKLVNLMSCSFFYDCSKRNYHVSLVPYLYLYCAYR